MRGFFPYYGAKWRAGPLYPPPDPALPVVEPFAGSAGYSVRHGVQRAILIDADPIIVGVWEYLLQVSAAEVMALPDLEAGQTTNDLDVCQEAKWLIGFWLKPAQATPGVRVSSWFTKYIARNPNSLWSPTTRRRIAHQVASIRGWSVRLGSFEDAPDLEATWFVDPPYVQMGKYYRKSHVDYTALASVAPDEDASSLARTRAPHGCPSSRSPTSRAPQASQERWCGYRTSGRRPNR